MTPVPVQVLGAARVDRDDARAVPWREPRLDKFASTLSRMLVEATARAWPPPAAHVCGRVGVYLATGETGLDVDAFLDAARVAWDEHPADPDYRWMGGRALRAIDPYYSLRTLSNGPAALLAMHLEATGPSLNVAHQRSGAAWALLAALDDLHTGRCDVALVGACDVPSVVSRRAIARRRALAPARDGAAVVVLQRPTDPARSIVRMAVRWEGPPGDVGPRAPDPTRRAGSGPEPRPDEDPDYGVTTLLRDLVGRGLADGWTTPCHVAADETGGGRVVIVVGA